MQSDKALPIISCLMILAAVTANHAFGSLGVAQAHRLPVESFPTRIASWQGGPVQPVDPSVQAAIPTAIIQDRTYTNPAGAQMDLTLVTATDSDHLHDPAICFPAQGFTLTDVHHPQIDGETANLMTATSGSDKLTVMYWTTGYYLPAPPRSAWLRKIADLRKRLVASHEGTSLLVRIICNDTPQNNAVLSSFTGSLSGPLHDLIKAGAAAKPVDQ